MFGVSAEGQQPKVYDFECYVVSCRSVIRSCQRRKNSMVQDVVSVALNVLVHGVCKELDRQF